VLATITNSDAIGIGLLILRVSVGVTLIAHGYNHIWGGGKIEGTAGWFASLGLKPGFLHAWLASITELVCGALLVVGFLNPLGAAGCVGVMVVAWITNHRPNGFFIFRPGEGYEYVMNLTAAGLALGAVGAGKFSIDRQLDYSIGSIDLLGLNGLVITSVVGIGGALLLLAVFWRPQPKAPAES
jgi:putative oxidoreductase